MKRDYTALLKAGNAAQIEKLEMNGHKSGFDEINIDYAYSRICQEVKELHNELFESDLVVNYGEYDIKKVRHEAADIANFAHMIILACDKEIDNE